jgi:secondary thiamine-phosphate synthase enzyme
MAVQGTQITLKTRGDNDVCDLTRVVEKAVRESRLREGVVTVFVPGSTAAITTLELEPGMVADLKRFLDEAVPAGRDYAHNHGGESNGHSHVRAALLGPSVTIPFSDGALALGTWQQIVLVDCDDRPRTRTVLISSIGD